MTQSESGSTPEAHKAWYKRLLDRVVRDMQRVGAVSGTAVESSPVWMVPHQILIAKIWPATQPRQYIWAIAVEDVVTDHINGNTAKSAQEAARHFAFKWQMDAERLLKRLENREFDQSAVEQIDNHAKKLVTSAEQLYLLTERDDIWQAES